MTVQQTRRAAGAVGQRYLLPAILVISLFFLWGLANNLNDVLIKHFKKAFILSDFESGLVQSAFYFGYFCFAIPASLFMKKFGYKAAVVLGLLLFGIGALMFVPAAYAHSYGFFLIALYVIASGLSFLETSANPLVIALGDEASAARRLTFAQSFNPLGSITGVIAGSAFILSGVELTPRQTEQMSAGQLDTYFRSEALAVVGPYVVIGLFVLAWALLVTLTRFPSAVTQPDEGDDAGSLAQFGALFRIPSYMAGVVAQFFYVGAQVGIWSYLIRYAQVELPGTPEKDAAAMLTWSLVLFLGGRFLGTLLMRWIDSRTLLAVFAVVDLLLCAIAAIVGGQVGLYALIATSLFMSIMFPTIFALSLKGLGSLKKAASSILVMAIIGGAIITLIMGFLSDTASIATAMFVPLACFAIIAAFALYTTRSGKTGPNHAATAREPS